MAPNPIALDQEDSYGDRPHEEAKTRIDEQEIQRQNQAVSSQPAATEEREAMQHHHQQRKSAVTRIGRADHCFILPQRQEDQWDRDIRIRERAVQLALELERQQHRGKDTDANEEGIYARVPVSEGVEKLVGNQADSLVVFAVLPEKEFGEAWLMAEEWGEVAPLIVEKNVDRVLPR